MANKDGVLSIGIEYKAELNKMIADLEGGLDTISKNNQLSKGMKQQFDNVIAEVRNFKATMEKELATLGSGKVDKTAFKSFKQTVANNFKTVREDIDRLDLAVSTLNSQMEIISNGFDLSKSTKEFADFEDYVNRTNEAVSLLIDTLGQQGVSLFSFDNRNISDTKNKIKEIDDIIKQLDTDKGAKFELFDEKEAQSELDRLSVQLKSTLELMEHTEKQMSNMDNSTVGFKKMQGDFALLQLKAASLNDTIEMLYEVTEGKGIFIKMDDKSIELYDKYTEDLSDNLESIIASAKNAKKELSTLLESQKQPTVKVSSEMNPNSSELATTVTIETTSSELWKKLSPILTDLQGILNSNPVVAPVKLVVAPNAVSSTENGDVGKVSSAYSKKYAKVLAETGEDTVIDLEGVYKKTFTSIMDTGVSYAKETIGKIQDIFDKSPINIKYDVSQEEIDKIQNFVLSNKDGKKIDISGQITKAKQEVEDLNINIEKTSTLLQETKSKGNVEFDGFDKFTDDLSKSIGKLEELQNILKALQNIEITLAKASGLSSITEIENQWESLEKRIINATKLDGSFRKNASINKIASEYQKYIDMGGTNALSNISKIQENKDTINAIISKAKEFQKQDFTNDSVEKLSVDLDGVIDKFNELINTVKTATNALYKIIRDGNVSGLDKQWSSISNKFKSIADESGKINLSKQKTDIKELMEMYQKYLNAGGMKSTFDLTDNTETLTKLNKVYSQINNRKLDTSVVSKEKGEFGKVEKSVDSLTDSINTKTDAIKTEANTVELAARAEVKSIGKIIESVNQLIERIKSISDIKPKINISDTIQSDKSNISSGTQIEDVIHGDEASKINEIAEATNNLADAENRLNIIEDKKSAEKYWQGRFKDSVADITKTNDELVKMNKYYSELEKMSKKVVSAQNKVDNANIDIDNLTKREKQTPDYVKAVENYRIAINELQNCINRLNDNGIKSQDDINELNRLQKAVDETSKSIKNMPAYEKGTSSAKSSTVFLKIEELRDKYKGMSKDMQRELDRLERKFAGLGDRIDTGRAIGELKQFETQLIKTGTATNSLWSAMKDKAFYNFANQLGTMVSFYDLINIARQAGQAVIDLNTNITELAKVSEATSSQIYDDFNSYADIAKEVGGTISDTISATADWSRNGYNIPDAKELAEVAMIYKNVGDGIDIDQANEYLISTLRGFKLEAKDAMDIIDSINEVANNEPISSAGIGEALQRSAAAFNVANTSLQESIGLVTSTNSVLQSPEKVGSMWTTVSARIRGAKTELEDAGLETDGMVESTSKLQSLIKGMTGFDILEDDQKTFKSIYDIIIGIGEEFQNLSGVDQAALLEALAGKRQSNALAATLNNIDLLKKAYDEATNAEGSAMAEQEKYQQSIQYSIDKTKASLEELANDFVSSDFLKGLIDFGDKLINLLDLLIDKFGVLGTTAIVGGGILGGKNLGKTYECTVFKFNCFEYALYT